VTSAWEGLSEEANRIIARSRTRAEVGICVSADAAEHYRFFTDLLGRKSRDQIYDHITTQYRYGREEIPPKIRETSYGDCAISLGCDFVHVLGFEFFDYLDALRASLKETQRDENAHSWLGSSNYDIDEVPAIAVELYSCK